MPGLRHLLRPAGGAADVAAVHALLLPRVHHWLHRSRPGTVAMYGLVVVGNLHVARRVTFIRVCQKSQQLLLLVSAQ